MHTSCPCVLCNSPRGLGVSLLPQLLWNPPLLLARLYPLNSNGQILTTK